MSIHVILFILSNFGLGRIGGGYTCSWGAIEQLHGLDQEAAALVSRLSASVVEVRAGSGVGAGTIWRAHGLIVTNDHVVPHDRAEIRLADGRTALGHVVARDLRNDL